jgi:isopenicillin-N N-acyltransferase-like protein
MNTQLGGIALGALVGMALWAPATFACTLWGAAGTAVDGGGTLVAKNRDWAPDHRQILKKVAARGSRRAFFGLYAEDNESSGFKAGINDAGLTVVNASASCLPAALRDSLPHRTNMVRRLLESFTSVSEVLGSPGLFDGQGPMFYLLADGAQVAWVEVGPSGKAAIRTTASGTLAHTNHYLSPELVGFNQKSGPSSQARLARIQVLLAQGSWNPDRFWGLTNDTHDGPDNSLWRTGGRPGAERTLASWVVAEQPGQAPRVWVRLANPGEAVTESTFTLDAVFWKD